MQKTGKWFQHFPAKLQSETNKIIIHSNEVNL